MTAGNGARGKAWALGLAGGLAVGLSAAWVGTARGGNPPSGRALEPRRGPDWNQAWGAHLDRWRETWETRAVLEEVSLQAERRRLPVRFTEPQVPTPGRYRSDLLPLERCPAAVNRLADAWIQARVRAEWAQADLEWLDRVLSEAGEGGKQLEAMRRDLESRRDWAAASGWLLGRAARSRVPLEARELLEAAFRYASAREAARETERRTAPPFVPPVPRPARARGPVTTPESGS